MWSQVTSPLTFPLKSRVADFFNCVSPQRFLIFNRIIQEQEFLAFPRSFISIISNAFRFQRTVWVLITRFWLLWKPHTTCPNFIPSYMWNLKCAFIKMSSHFGVWNFTSKVEIIISKTNIICTLFFHGKLRYLAVIRWKMLYSSTGFSMRCICGLNRRLWAASFLHTARQWCLFNWYFWKQKNFEIFH